jgi:molybdopterin converting factor small subunit
VTVTVLLGAALADAVGGRERFEVDGPTVETALQALPVADRILLDGELRPLVEVHLDGVDVRRLDGTATAAPDGAELRVVAKDAGGS